jgi:hypothetical protein
MASAKKVGLYDQTVEGGANVYTNLSSGARNVNLVVREKITLVKESVLFLSDDYHLVPVSKKALFKLFPVYKKNIEDYLSNRSMDYGKAEDLKDLFAYLKSIGR